MNVSNRLSGEQKPRIVPGPGIGRICVLLHDLRGGGAERIMLRLVTEFIAAGRAVDLVLVKRRGEYLNLIPAEARVVDLGKDHVLNAVPAIARYLRRERPAVVLTALTHMNIAAVIARALSRTRVRLVLSERNQISMKANRALGLRSRLTYMLVRLLYPMADAVTAVSTGVSEDLERFAGLKKGSVRTIFNPVTNEEMLRRAAQPVTDPWFQPGQPPVVLGVGRLTHQKGFDVLLRAFKRVRAEFPARLVIAGEGAERGKLEALCRELGLEEDARLIGFVPNPYSLMSRSGVFVLSSRFEGLPGVLLEAMYCGAPVVSADCPSGAGEILDGGRYGKLVPVEDAEAMAKAILEVLREKPPAEVERARQYNVDDAVAAYLELLECPR